MKKSAFLFAAALCLVSMRAAAIDASDKYRSPRNPERKIRASTELIVLHTTEAAERGSLRKLSERGECHYCVTEKGEVYRIVDRDREAFHAGRSMWNGREDVDKFSIGIECVGYHDKPMSAAQLAAIAQLVKELKGMYRLGDAAVVTHSQVAYGAPNKWQKKKHRGRKRCGMLFATTTIRRLLGLKQRPKFDPDVRAGRLVVADEYLNKILYGGVDFMARNYAKPAETKLERKAAPRTRGELTSQGFRLRGLVGAGQSPIKIVGENWNAPDTYYVIRDKATPGSAIDPKRIEKGTEIWRRD